MSFSDQSVINWILREPLEFILCLGIPLTQSRNIFLKKKKLINFKDSGWLEVDSTRTGTVQVDSPRGCLISRQKQGRKKKLIGLTWIDTGVQQQAFYLINRGSNRWIYYYLCTLFLRILLSLYSRYLTDVSMDLLCIRSNNLNHMFFFLSIIGVLSQLFL